MSSPEAGRGTQRVSQVHVPLVSLVDIPQIGCSHLAVAGLDLPRLHGVLHHGGQDQDDRTVRCADLVGRGHRRLHRKTGQGPAEVLVRVLGRFRRGEVESLTQALERVGDAGDRLLDQSGEHDLTLLDQRDEQIVLALEMPVENPHGHTRLRRDVLHRQLFGVEPPHQAGGGVDQVPGLPHGLVRGRPEGPSENPGMPVG